MVVRADRVDLLGRRNVVGFTIEMVCPVRYKAMAPSLRLRYKSVTAENSQKGWLTVCDHIDMKNSEPIKNSQAWPSIEEQQLLKASFLRLIPSWEALSDHLYLTLFEEHPEVNSLFKNEMEPQKEKLTLMIATAVDLLDDRPAFERMCRECGARHTGYGAVPAHYPVVVRLLEQGLVGVSDTLLSAEEVGAWQRLVALIVSEMLIGSGQTETETPQA